MQIFNEGEIIHSRYRVERLLGMGGFGQVYKVYDIQNEHTCALKILYYEIAENKQIIRRFIQEARILESISHPNIIKICEVYIGDEIKYYTMEYLEGENLAELIVREKGQKPAMAKMIIKQVLEATAYLQKNEILHRDLKPSNIFILRTNEQQTSESIKAPFIKIIDLGIAKALNSTDTKTLGKELLGTPLYMAPEQLDNHESTCASDVYSIGEILWHILCGKPRCEGLDIGPLMAFKSKVPKFANLFKNFQGTSDEKKDLLVLKEWLNIALQPNPRKRFQKCDEALEFLESTVTRSKRKWSNYLSKIAFILALLLLIASAISISSNHFTAPGLDSLQVNSPSIKALDRKGNTLWEFEDQNCDSKAVLLKDLSPVLKEAVLVTSSESEAHPDPSYASCGKIQLLDSKGNILWLQDIGGKEWLSHMLRLHNVTFWRAEDIDNDKEKELFFAFTNMQLYPGLLLILNSNDGSLHGAFWNPGESPKAYKLWNKGTQRYLSLAFNNTPLGTGIIATIPVNHPFITFSPGWPEHSMSILHQRILLLAKKNSQVNRVTPMVSLWDMIPENLPLSINAAIKKEQTVNLIIKAGQSSFYFTLGGYPLDASGKELYPTREGALSPNELLWNLNPYFTFVDNGLFEDAENLCEKLLFKSPHLPNLDALLYRLSGKASLALGNRANAIEDFSHSLKFQKTGNMARIDKAESLILSDRFIEASQLLFEDSTEKKNIEYTNALNKLKIYIHDIQTSSANADKNEYSLISLWKKFPMYAAFLEEQHILYQGNPKIIPLADSWSYEHTEIFWRWRITREVLLQKRDFKKCWKNIPDIYQEAPTMQPLKNLLTSVPSLENLASLEKSAQSNIEDYMFLPAVYLLYANEAFEYQDTEKAKYFAKKALKAHAIGFLREQALELTNSRRLSKSSR